MEVQVTSMEVIKIPQLTLHKLERDSWVESKESRKRMYSSTSLRLFFYSTQGTGDMLIIHNYCHFSYFIFIFVFNIS
jgi:hypothetical protein